MEIIFIFIIYAQSMHQNLQESILFNTVQMIILCHIYSGIRDLCKWCSLPPSDEIHAPSHSFLPRSAKILHFQLFLSHVIMQTLLNSPKSLSPKIAMRKRKTLLEFTKNEQLFSVTLFLCVFFCDNCCRTTDFQIYEHVLHVSRHITIQQLYKATVVCYSFGNRTL